MMPEWRFIWITILSFSVSTILPTPAHSDRYHRRHLPLPGLFPLPLMLIAHLPFVLRLHSGSILGQDRGPLHASFPHLFVSAHSVRGQSASNSTSTGYIAHDPVAMLVQVGRRHGIIFSSPLSDVEKVAWITLKPWKVIHLTLR